MVGQLLNLPKDFGARNQKTVERMAIRRLASENGQTVSPFNAVMVKRIRIDLFSLVG
jgi:hypothetical protein